MKKSTYTEPQIAFALKQAETGKRVDEVCRKMDISEATFYNWKKKYDDLGVNELRRLRQLEDENNRLKQIVADLTLDKQKLQFSIFPEEIYYSKKIDQTRTLKMNSIFTLSARQKRLVEEKETGTSEVIFKNSGLVAPTDNLPHQIIRILKKLCMIMSGN